MIEEEAPLKEQYPFVNPPLPYGYDALEPYIDEKTMRVHYDGHLAAYTEKLNGLLAKQPRLQSMSLEELILWGERCCTTLGRDVRRNAGGVWNHRFYFGGLTPRQSPPEGKLLGAIQCDFGSLEALREALTETAMGVFGSGYAWLLWDGQHLCISASRNQETILRQTPLLNIDMWEHAYYLKHQNQRAGYLRDLFMVVDWARAGRRLDLAETHSWSILM